MEFLVTLADFQVLQQHKIPRVLRYIISHNYMMDVYTE